MKDLTCGKAVWKSLSQSGTVLQQMRPWPLTDIAKLPSRLGSSWQVMGCPSSWRSRVYRACVRCSTPPVRQRGLHAGTDDEDAEPCSAWLLVGHTRKALCTSLVLNTCIQKLPACHAKTFSNGKLKSRGYGFRRGMQRHREGVMAVFSVTDFLLSSANGFCRGRVHAHLREAEHGSLQLHGRAHCRARAIST